MIIGMAFLVNPERKKWFLPLGAVFLAASPYFYHNLRLFLPLLLIGYGLFYRKTLLKQKTQALLGLALGVLILLPLFYSFTKNNWLARPAAVAIFTDENYQSQLMEGMYRHATLGLPMIRAFNNKLVFYGREVSVRYLAHFSPQFLFSDLDATPRISIAKVGKMHLVSLPFLVLGLYQIIKKRNRINNLLLWWLIIAPLPASLTVDSPHGLRSIALMPILQIVTVIGIVRAYQYLKLKRPKFIPIFILITILFYISGTGYFLWRYFLFYPEETAALWQPGHQEMAKKISLHQDRFDRVVVTTNYGQPHIFIAFFTPIDPQFYQKEVTKANQQSIFNARIPYIGKIQFRAIQEEDYCLDNALIVINNGGVSEKVPRVDQVYISNRFHTPELAFEFFDTNELLVRQEKCPEEKVNK